MHLIDKQTILVYQDEGVGVSSFHALYTTLVEWIDSKRFSVQSASADLLLTCNWEAQCAALAIPGGADRPYQEKLSGEGNRRIKNFVLQGGTYLGFCAGAYYAAQSIEFELGLPQQIVEKRELGFFPGIAYGPAYGVGVYDSESDQGAQVASIQSTRANGPSKVSVYYNGGCAFREAGSSSSIEVLYRYEDIAGNPPAIVKAKVGLGTAILSGVHPEYSGSSLDETELFLKPIRDVINANEIPRRHLVSFLLREARLL